jgi:uncharacterized protein with HEPN domain
MPPDDRIRVLHMIEAAETAQAFIVGRQPDDLATDRMLSLALERAIEIIGEAATRISVDTKDAALAVPWAQIAAMRHRLVHAYFDVDTAILWKTVVEELPKLLEQLRPLIADSAPPA